MKILTRFLTYFFSLLLVASCELNTNEIETHKLKSAETQKRSRASNEELITQGEIFNQYTIKAEYQAIDNGFEPEIGIEERIAVLNYYEELVEAELYLGLAGGFPIGPGHFPVPPCPPRPRHDCRIPKVNLSAFTLIVFCQNPEFISSSIITEEGMLAELSGVDYDEEHSVARLNYSLVNPELNYLPSSVNVTTGVIIDGSEQEVPIEMPVIGGVFHE